MLRERVFDPREPRVEHILRPRIERRESAEDPGFALLDHELRSRDEKHRRADHRHAQLP